MLTVLTQNVWGGAPLWRLRRGALARRITAFQPDLVGLQEVHSFDPGDTTSQAHELARLAGGYEVIFATGQASPSRKREGVALLSRHPVRETEVKILTQDKRDPLDRLGPRVVLRALVETPAGQVDAYVTHLSVSRRARSRSVLELVAFAAGARGAHPDRKAVLLGDLNAGPDEPSIGVLIGDRGGPGMGWLDAWSSANGSRARGGTWPGFFPRRRIDYAFVHPSDGWVVHSCERLPPSGSDHLGVVARLDLILP